MYRNVIECKVANDTMMLNKKAERRKKEWYKIVLQEQELERALSMRISEFIGAFVKGIIVPISKKWKMLDTVL